MLILGLAGQARCGKDTIANYLVKRYGFIKFAFSDALYREVQQAFGLPDQSLLRSAETKDAPQPELALSHCTDPGFLEAMKIANLQSGTFDNPFHLDTTPRSPRWVLQRWGTEYRRAQDPNYWVHRAADFVYGVQYGFTYPEHRPQFFVETGTRFENEREWITQANDGNIWHIHRDGIVAPGQGHSSAAVLPVLPGERELWNNDTVERLHYGIDLMLSQDVQQVKVLPLERTVHASTSNQ